MSDSATPWTATHQALSSTISWSLLKFMSLVLLVLSNHLILCCPLLLLPSIFPGIRVFSKESVLCIRWPQYWSFSFSISPSNEYSGFISFKIGWFDWFHLLAIQGTLKSLCLAFFMSQHNEASIKTKKIMFRDLLSWCTHGDAGRVSHAPKIKGVLVLSPLPSLVHLFPLTVNGSYPFDNKPAI